MRSALTALALAATFLVAPAHAVLPGQSDRFESGTTLNWRVGSPHPTPPTVLASGGPASADDADLLLQAEGGAGPASLSWRRRRAAGQVYGTGFRGEAVVIHPSTASTSSGSP